MITCTPQAEHAANSWFILFRNSTRPMIFKLNAQIEALQADVELLEHHQQHMSSETDLIRSHKTIDAIKADMKELVDYKAEYMELKRQINQEAA